MDLPKPEAAASKRRSYSDDFKRDAVRLIVEEGYSFKAATQAVGVCGATLRSWHAKIAPKPKPCGEEATIAELQAENKRLRKTLKRTEMEREILKKATAYFARETP
jgi:transposase